MKNFFTQEELLSAILELRKIWEYEKSTYDGSFLTELDFARLDDRTVGYGIRLGALRKIFDETPRTS